MKLNCGDICPKSASYTESLEPTFQAKAISDSQLWIIGIVAFAVIVTILATIIIYCLYNQSDK